MSIPPPHLKETGTTFYGQALGPPNTKRHTKKTDRVFCSSAVFKYMFAKGKGRCSNSVSYFCASLEKPKQKTNRENGETFVFSPTLGG